MHPVESAWNADASMSSADAGHFMAMIHYNALDRQMVLQEDATQGHVNSR
jgi:hypothetical protein